MTELDLTWVYLSYKLGIACAVLFASALLMLIASCFVMADCCDETETKAKLIAVACLFVMPPFLAMACIAPGKDEVKAAAAYSLSKKVATSDKASDLYDRLMKALETKIGE